MKTVYNNLSIKCDPTITLDGKNIIDLFQEILQKLNELETRINKLDTHIGVET